MNKITISMDMDGVLYPFDDAFNALMVQYGGEPQDFSQWVDFSTMPGEIVSRIWQDPTLFNREAPYPDAQWLMAELAARDVEVYIVTRPGRNIGVTIPAKWDWIQRFFPAVGVSHFVTTASKWLFRTDMIVDDFPDYVRKWQNHNPGGTAVMVQRSWNEDVVAKFKNRGILVADNGVGSILPFVDKLIKEKANVEKS